MTALAVLRLAEQHKLDLDADVNQYLKSWKIPKNRFTDQKTVTLRELLSHTAGATVHGFGGYAAGQPVPTLVQVLNGVSPAHSAPIRIDAVPGSRFRYAGGNYVIIQQILIDVTGEAVSGAPDAAACITAAARHDAQHVSTASSHEPPATGGDSAMMQMGNRSREAHIRIQKWPSQVTWIPRRLLLT